MKLRESPYINRRKKRIEFYVHHLNAAACKHISLAGTFNHWATDELQMKPERVTGGGWKISIPMLPNDLSSGMCSLRPDEDRLVESCLIEIDTQGEVVGFEICEGIIRSARRMTYTQVQAILDGDQETRLAFGDLVPEFEQMYQLALRLNKKRHRRGSLDFDLPEPVVEFDPDGNMQAIVRSERGWSHRLIEEFMLAANECVAHWIESNAIPGIYRVHEVPDPKRIVEFEETAAQFGYTLGFSNLPVKRVQTRGDRRQAQSTGRHAPTHEIPESIPVTPQMYQRLTAKIQGTPEERILSYLMLRSLRQAHYSEKNEGHFALAAPCYTHFTSPIRRYPDLIVHRVAKSLLRAGISGHGALVARSGQESEGGPLKPAVGLSGEQAGDVIAEADLALIATESSDNERRAAEAERELVEWKKLKFMRDRVGEDFSAMILSATKYGLFVELDDLFVEGLVPIQSLGALDGDYYTYRDNTRQIIGEQWGRKFVIGQRVRVLLDRVDAAQKRLQFSILDEEAEAAARLRGPSKPKSGKAGKKKSRARQETKSMQRQANKPHPSKKAKRGKRRK